MKKLLPFALAALLGCAKPNISVYPDLEYTDKFLSKFQQKELKYLGKNDFKKYSKLVLKQDDDFKHDVTCLQDYIVAAYMSHEHSFRPYMDYLEGPKQITKLEDKFLLVQIKNYIDFFDNAQKPFIDSLFVGGYSDVKGGVTLLRHNTIAFVEFPNLAKDYQAIDGSRPLNPKKTYHNRGVYLFPRVGWWHTHTATPNPRYRHGGIKEEICAGPSGSANPIHTTRSTKEHNSRSKDLGNFRNFIDENPYYVDLVITEMQKDYYNIDVVYRNPKDRDDRIRVFDLMNIDFRVGGNRK